MTQSEYESEVNFRLCKSIFATLAARGVIAQKDVRHLLRAAAEKYHALIGELEVNSIAGEKNFTVCSIRYFLKSLVQHGRNHTQNRSV